jgi:hypothetical protein
MGSEPDSSLSLPQSPRRGLALTVAMFNLAVAWGGDAKAGRLEAAESRLLLTAGGLLLAILPGMHPPDGGSGQASGNPR